MNKNEYKKSSIVRIILCVLVMIIIILGWVEIIPKTAGMIVSSVILCGICAWNGAESFMEGRKKGAVLNFIMAAIMLFIMIATIVI